MPEQETTIRELAALVKESTASIATVAHVVDNFSHTVDGLVAAVGTLSKKVDENATAIEDLARMTKEGIELLLLTDHRRRIERLEDEVKVLMAAR